MASASMIAVARRGLATRRCRRSGSQTLPKTVAHGISVGSWKTKPISPSGRPVRRRCRRTASRCVPAVGSPRPAMIRSTVDLPQPEGPSRLTNSPLADVERHVAERERAVGEDLGDALQRHQRPAVGRGFGRVRQRARSRSMAAVAAVTLVVRVPVTIGLRRGGGPPAGSRSAYFLRSMPTPLQTNSVV